MIFQGCCNCVYCFLLFQQDVVGVGKINTDFDKTFKTRNFCYIHF